MKKKLIEALTPSGLHRKLSFQRKDKNYIIRQGFYYQNGKTAKDLENRLVTELNTACIEHKIIDSGQIWKPFKGGSTIANSSHWYVKFIVLP
jgi:hypothetical protein